MPRFGYDVIMKQTNLLTLADVAERVGVGYESMRTYHQRAAKNRRAGAVKQGDLPAPDKTFGRSPVWAASTIERWVAERPGRGRVAKSKP